MICIKSWNVNIHLKQSGSIYIQPCIFINISIKYECLQNRSIWVYLNHIMTRYMANATKWFSTNFSKYSHKVWYISFIKFPHGSFQWECTIAPTCMLDSFQQKSPTLHSNIYNPLPAHNSTTIEWVYEVLNEV